MTTLLPQTTLYFLLNAEVAEEVEQAGIWDGFDLLQLSGHSCLSRQALQCARKAV